VEIAVLASGSSGNSLLVSSRGTSILVDAGISRLAIRRRLAVFGFAPGQLGGVLLTHEHSDHVRGLEVLLRRHPLPVWATRGTWSRIDMCAPGGGELASGREIQIGRLLVHPVATSHDAAEPVAFIIDDGAVRLGVCTDTGVMTSLLRERLKGCDLLLIEANHDADMLRHGPYPWPLKQRIASRLGHLANHQTMEALDDLRGPALRGVVGLHLSAENNRPEMVVDGLATATTNGARVAAVSRTEMLRIRIDGTALEMEARPVPAARRRT